MQAWWAVSFLAMDFVEGRDLRAVRNRCAKKQVAFPIDVAVYIIKELCRGLAYAHSFPDLNLVHRDISPPNVLVSYTGEVKLTDFGLASSTLKLEKTAPGIIYGKVAYMSPEQARGEKLNGERYVRRASCCGSCSRAASCSRRARISRRPLRA
jgi:serine/threonine protein kinase